MADRKEAAADVQALNAVPGLTAEQALIRAADHGIHQMPVPTPFAVGRINCYLIEDEPLTMVDAGPNSDRALAELERHLAEHDRRLEEIELILLTHNHLDHVGLVGTVVERSGAEVAALGIGAERLANFDTDRELEDAFAVELMLRHGIPESTVMPLREISRSFQSFGAPARVTRPLADGETVELAQRSLRVLHRPGHSPMDTLFEDAELGHVLCGDHLLARISSNPLLSRPLAEVAQEAGRAGAIGEAGGDSAAATGRSRALVAYLESMRATAEMSAELFLPGHGEPITEHRALIADRIAKHERRKEKIFGLIGEGRRTAYE
ncbi:MAG TPA: MBL fold metallo-hydrolase, partial [Solirubrobacterales bacterium]|nr:MBL fold metallo-hydrolase [Solirubrobacterales bacterium]